MCNASSSRFRSLVLTTIGACLVVLTIPNVVASPLPINQADWNDGVVVLVDNKVLSGEIHYNASHQLVLLRSDDGQTITTLTSRQVQRFFYYNPQDNIIHRFLAIEQRPRLAYAVRSFYEVVAEGPVLYLRQPNQCSVHTTTRQQPARGGVPLLCLLSRKNSSGPRVSKRTASGPGARKSRHLSTI